MLNRLCPFIICVVGVVAYSYKYIFFAIKIKSKHI